MTTYAWTPFPPTQCVRQAWLTLGGRSVLLDNPAGGWFCTELTLGWPEVRAVVNNRPDDDGIDDRTQYFGSRAITANVTVLAGAGARIDDVADNFAPFMLPSVRSVLHFILDRPGATERTITVRAAGYQYAIAGNSQRDVQLSWVASDPNVYDPTVNNVAAWAGSSTAQGRSYPLTFPRVYPTGGGSSTVGTLRSAGDLYYQPLLRIYGPITTPRVHISWTPDGVASGGAFDVTFVTGFQIDALHWVDVDTNNKTAFRDSDPTQSVFASINFAATTWPVLPPNPGFSYMQLWGSGSTSNVTQVQAIWQDAYLT